MKRILTILFLAVVILDVPAENLTGPDFKGWLSGKGLAKGDSVFVEIDTTSKLAFSAASSDSRTFTLEFAGGEFGNLFSFLPQGRTGGDRSLSGAQDLSLNGRIPVVVQEVDGTGRALVRGSRAIEIEGRQESIEISGWVNARDVDGDRNVTFSRIADARLVYRTLLSSARDVLSAEDIRKVLAEVPAAAATPGTGAAVPATTASTAAATTPPAAAAPAASSLSLTDEKKLELLLVYLNRLVDLVFAQ